MKILKNDVKLPTFNFKLKKIKEHNIHFNKTNEYFLMYLNEKVIPFFYGHLNYDSQYKYKVDIIKIEYIETLFNNIIDELNKIKLNNYEDNDIQQISYFIFEDKILIENDCILLNNSTILYYDSDEKIEKFVNNIKEVIDLILKKWKQVNVPEISIIKEY